MTAPDTPAPDTPTAEPPMPAWFRKMQSEEAAKNTRIYERMLSMLATRFVTHVLATVLIVVTALRVLGPEATLVLRVGGGVVLLLLATVTLKSALFNAGAWLVLKRRGTLSVLPLPGEPGAPPREG